jgi:hypothetical protein
MPPVKTELSIRVGADEVKVNIDIHVNGTRIASVNSADPDKVNEQFWKSFDMYSRELNNSHPDSGHYRAFQPHEWKPFLGWLCRETGLKLFESFEQDFEHFKNVRDLYGRIDSVFARVGW